MIESMPTLEAQGSARVMRKFTDEEVPRELVEKVLWAGTRAGSPHNVQPWSLLAVSDAAIRQKIGDIVTEAIDGRDPMPAAENRSDEIINDGVRGLMRNVASVPVIIFVCATDSYPPENPDSTYLWSSLGAVSQNMVVASRSIGLGYCPSIFHVLNEKAFRSELGIPDEQVIGSTGFLGWPQGKFGPVTRKPLDEVVHWQRW